MPHQCTNCSRTFPDGSKEMLSGCPDCGGNKFQFHPGSIDDLTAASDVDSDPSSSGSADSTARPRSASVAHDGETATDSTQPPATDAPQANPRHSGSESDLNQQDSAAGKEDHTQAAENNNQAADDVKEDSAQASARSDVVSPGELEAAKATSPEEPPSGSAADDADGDADRPDIEELRNELNEQFESIKILNPGQYEINLMELYDRDEYIISLREDGRYVIEVPDAWGVTDRE